VIETRAGRVLGWALPILVTLLAAWQRFANLARPKGFVFDEVYYVTGARQFLRNGVEYDYLKHAAVFIVHPPVGKWMIAVGIRLFGDSEFGWRFAVATLGSLSILILARVARRLFQSNTLGVIAGILLAVDGMHFVHSRFALLDLILMFWALCAFALLLIDRDRSRDYVELWGEFGRRPYRLLAGVCLGLAAGTKWSGFYIAIAFALLSLFWDRSAKRRIERSLTTRNVLGAGFTLGLLPLITYVASWVGWFRSSLGWDRHWADGRTTSWGFIPRSLRSLWHYHYEMYFFHTHLHTPHPYQSNPFGWLILRRPTAFYYFAPPTGTNHCVVKVCAQEVTALGNPLIWWAGIFALVFVAYSLVDKHDWRAGAILTGFAAGYLPWFAYLHRTVFSFYGIVFLPWLVLAVTYALGEILGARDDARRRWRIGIVAAFVVASIALFFYFLPVLDGQVIPYTVWHSKMWFSSWI
jgi:dolichyl-phosphate-mannose-protein mannosyltransferase